MNEEEIREYIRAKNTPVSNCVGLSQYFIGRHKVLPVYLTPEFEIEFNNKMCELEKLKEQLEASEKARKDVYDYINFLVIIDTQLAGGRFKDTIWGKELLEILDIDKGDKE